MYRTVTSDMPAPKRQRTNKHYAKKRASSLVRVPRALQTRGTPDGYYEIPHRQLFRLYGNTSTGLWNTNQSTGAPIGATGYVGLGMFFQLDTTNIQLGNGAPSATVSQSVPDFASYQAIFDLCKIASVEVEVWFTDHARQMNTSATTYGAPELFLTTDLNDVSPPSALSGVLDKKVITRVSPDYKRYKINVKPYVAGDAGTSDGTATITTLSLSQPSTYCRTTLPAVAHYGFKGCMALPTSEDSTLYTLNILVTQIRRYKMNQ